MFMNIIDTGSQLIVNLQTDHKNDMFMNIINIIN